MRTALGSSLLLLALSGLLAVPANADAATVCDAPDTTWVGPATSSGDRSWSLESNWSNGVPGTSSTACVPAGTVRVPLVPTGTTATVAAVDASAAGLDVEGSLTVTGSWDAGRLDVTDGQVVLDGPSALRDTRLSEGARLVVAGNATLGAGDQVIEDDPSPAGLLVVAATGLLTVDAPGGDVAVGGAVANHGTVQVVAGRLSVLGYSQGEEPVDSGSDGTWTAEPGTELWLGSPVLLDGSRLEGVLTYDATIPSGAAVTASRTRVWPGSSYPNPVPTLTGGGELVLTDDSELQWGVGDHITVRIPDGEQAKVNGWLEGDARAVIEGTATHESGRFAVLDSASLVVAPSGEVVMTHGGRPEWPDPPGQPTGTVVVDEGGKLVGGGAQGTLLRAILDNHGTVRAEGGAFRVATSAGTVVDGVLSGGRWEVGTGAALRLLDDPDQGATVGAITTNAAQVAIEGAGSNIRGLGALTHNRARGVLELGPEADLETKGRLRNAGTVTLEASARLATGGRFVQTESGKLQVGVSQAAMGRVTAGGMRDLAGTLVLSPEDGAWPPFATRRTVITSDGRAARGDAFDIVRAPRLSGLSARLHYRANRVRMRVVNTSA